MSKSYRIFFLATWFPHQYDPMSGLFVLRHAEALAKSHPVEVLAVVAHSESRQVETVVEEKGNLKITQIYYPKSTFFIPALRRFFNVYRHFLLQKKWLRQQVHAGNKPDIIHVHILTRSAIAALWARRKWKIPFVVTEHWSRYIPGTGLYKLWIRKVLTRYAVKKAAVMTVVSNQMRDVMRQRGLENPDYRKIYNVVDPNVFHLEPKDPMRSKKQIIHISCFDDPVKNISGMLRVVRKLEEKRQDFQFRLVGDGPDFKNLVAYADQLGFGENTVIFSGLMEGKVLGNALAAADFMVMFSHRENMPVVIFEAFACGLPVISSNVGGIKEVLTEERGLLVPPGDEAALLEAMEYMLDRTVDYNAESIRHFAVTHASPEAVKTSLEAIYQSVLGR